ncbi:MAG: permease [Myxococcales bacterium]|nr:permease [Myxococcales bacterium]
MTAGTSFLLAALVALFVGPALLHLGRGSATWRAGIDGLALALVGGLCLLHVGPHALAHGGLAALGALVVGAVLPGLLRRVSWTWGAVAVLCLHAAVDGAALSLADPAVGLSLTVAVVAHRIPVGLVVASSAGTLQQAVWVLLAVALATVAGFAVGSGAHELLAEEVHGVIEGLVAGGLLHVVSVDRSQSCGHHVPREERQASAGGALLGLICVAAFTWMASDDGELHHVQSTVETLGVLTLTSAPALLVGFVLAGLLSALLDPARATWLGGGSRAGQAMRGVVFGLPLPVCSCGVVPMYRSLVRSGVPITAGLAFLVATPELGLDAVLLSIPLLGVPLTIARVVAAFGVALVVAWLVGGGSTSAPAVAQPIVTDSEETLGSRLRRGVRYGLGDLVDHTLPWIVAGLVIAALAEPLLGHDLLVKLPPVVQVPLAALVGIPLYVCASGATPLAAMAVHKGLSAGAALTLLLAGPATNMTTFGILSSLHGRALAVRFGIVLTVVAVAVGWTVDAIGLGLPELLPPDHLHEGGGSVLGWLCLAVLGGLGVASLVRQGARGMMGQLLHPIHDH